MSILPRRTILTIGRNFTKGAVTKISPQNTNSNLTTSCLNLPKIVDRNMKRTVQTAALKVAPEENVEDAVHSIQGIPIRENASKKVLFRDEFFKLPESPNTPLATVSTPQWKHEDYPRDCVSGTESPPRVVEQSSQYKITPTPASSISMSNEFDAEHCFCGYLEIAKLKKELEKSGFVHCSGSMMKKLLLFCGADLEELQILEAGHLHSKVSKDPEPAMSHRQISFHRMLIEPKDSAIKFKQIAFQGLLTGDAINTVPNIKKEKNGKSLELCDSYQFVPAKVQAVTQLQSNEIASNAGEGSTFCKVSFRRCNYRDWPLPPLTYAESSVPEAMSILHAHMLPANHHAQQNIERKHKITINDQLLIRIHRKLHTDESSSPTPEGIHQDGSEISSVVLIGLNGVKSGGESRIWKLDTPTGNYTEDEFNKGYLKDKLLLNHALQNPWETVIFNDRKVKHEARAFDGERPCARDVIVNFCRKPLKGGYDKRVIDYSLMSV